MSTDPDHDDAPPPDDAPLSPSLRGPDFPPPEWAADWTDEARAKALGVFAGITDWYSRAATSYAFAPTPHRQHRDRFVKLARIMRAALFAHLTDDNEYLQASAAKAANYLKEKEGADARGAGLVVMGGDVIPHPADQKRSLLQFIAGSMYLWSHHIDDYAANEEDAAKVLASELAAPIVYKFFDLYADGIDPQRRADERSVGVVQGAIQAKLLRTPLGEWIRPQTICRLIFDVLEALGHKNPKSFISILEKDTDPATVYFHLDDDERAVIVSEDPDGNEGHVLVFGPRDEEAE
ncbi:hypothetical protein [Polyangium jinanense]|uniref:Uncharacterized protein n=1 Tax=Polyangium jinanense TaxID=2829994 RepID=A0A9X3XGJ2_9BACT|nr:hypothetical protein [Polyangium jinanense]MDC3961799.1 hypothetical protein [Polyangium jinanense]MDC3988308.1 hypothetical protein [Polyangium jinanense]